MFIDSHVHTNASPCGKDSLKMMIHRAVELELDAIIITDHDLITKVPQHPQLKIFSGTEISSYGGHILAYGIQDPITYGMDDIETVEHVHDHGGVAIAAHPYRRLLGRPKTNRRVPPPYSLGDKICDLNIDGLETLNGANMFHENRKAHNMSKILMCTQLGGSDAHRINNVGAALTYVPYPVDTLDDFIAAIKKQETKTLLYGQRSRFEENVVPLNKMITPQNPLYGGTHQMPVLVGYAMDNNCEKDHSKPIYSQIRAVLDKTITAMEIEHQASTFHDTNGNPFPKMSFVAIPDISIDSLLDNLESTRQQIQHIGEYHGVDCTITLAVQVLSSSLTLSSMSLEAESRDLPLTPLMNSIHHAQHRGGNQIILR